MTRGCLPAVLLLAGSSALAQQSDPRIDSLIARAKALELATPYVPPPGDALEHHAAGFAKIVCSAVFITGLDPAFAVENVGYFTAPYAERAKLGKPVIDRAHSAVHVTLPSGVTRTALFLGDQGCVTLPAGAQSPSFTPIRVKNRVSDSSTQPWPTGDALPQEPVAAALDTAQLRRAADTGFEPAAMAARFGRPVSQHRPGAGELPGATRGRTARRGVLVVPATRPVRQAWNALGGDRDRPLRRFPDARIRPGLGA